MEPEWSQNGVKFEQKLSQNSSQKKESTFDYFVHDF